MSRHAKAVAMLLAAASASTFTAQPALPEARVSHGWGLAEKKDTAVDASVDTAYSLPLLSTLEQVHTGEHIG